AAWRAARLLGAPMLAAVTRHPTLATLIISTTSTTYPIQTTTPSLPAATPISFDITPAAASVLAFTVQPTTTLAGATITPPVQVSARDGLGNLVPTFVGTVTVVISSGTGTTGATLAGTTTVAAVGGIATCATLG